MPARTHGESRSTKEYATWRDIRGRCRNPRNKAFAYYGGRGITVDASWDSFEVFLADVGRAPSPAHTLDRIDNDAGYGPGNCRWVTMHVQSRNRRNTRNVTAFGLTMTITDWSSEVGVPLATLRHRLVRLALPPEVAILLDGSRGGPAGRIDAQRASLLRAYSEARTGTGETG